MADLKKVCRALTMEEAELAFEKFKVTKTKTAYPTDEALKKIIYLATVEASRKWTVPIREWKSCILQFAIYLSDRPEPKLMAGK